MQADHIEQGAAPTFDHGFWGNVDTTTDWCEPNYVVTPYVAEFFNTMSSAPLVLWGILGCALAWRQGFRETRFYLCFLSLSLVGIGSMAFHGTLRFQAQLLDELPMMVGTFCSLYTALETRRARGRQWLCAVFLFLMLVQFLLYVVFKLYFIFLCGYITLFFTQLTFTEWISRSYSRKARSLLFVAWFLMWSGAMLWIAENQFCALLEPLKLHSIWHLMAGYGSYLDVVALLMIRAEHRQMKPKLELAQCLQMHYVQVYDHCL